MNKKSKQKYVDELNWNIMCARATLFPGIAKEDVPQSTIEDIFGKQNKDMSKKTEKKKGKLIYMIGSLRNENIPHMAKKIRKLGFEVFDDWFSPGPEADDFWRKYEKVRGSTYKEALNNWAGTHVYEFDKHHIDRADIGILYMPAGKSGHLELGYMIGSGKKCFILFDKEPERWDVMYQFAEDVFFSKKELFKALENLEK